MPNGAYDNGGNQMNLEAWGQIKFNWADNSDNRANFLGCRLGQVNDGKSWTDKLSELKNFHNVTVSRGTSFAHPSKYTNILEPPSFHRDPLGGKNDNYLFYGGMPDGTPDFIKTYMVPAYSGWDPRRWVNLSGVQPIRYSKNGQVQDGGNQSGDKKGQ